MSSINTPVQTSITNFVQNIFTPSIKNIIFWDTSAILEILRFPYREGNIDTYKVYNKLNGLIQADEIYSLASTLTITEWNDHEENVRNDLEKSLLKTEKYHSTCIEISNEINASAYMSEPLHNKALVQSFELLADSILSKTIFIQTEEIANSALERVRDKRPPSAKKPEFKDCAIWETVISLSREIYAIDTASYQVFYTVNTDDFVDKSREPKQFYGALLTEASLSNLQCSFKSTDVGARI